MYEENDADEENDEDDAKIAVFTTMATMWINDEDLGFCPSRNCVSQRRRWRRLEVIPESLGPRAEFPDPVFATAKSTAASDIFGRLRDSFLLIPYAKSRI